jgi:K+-transporting ATPase KdpF subunit
MAGKGGALPSAHERFDLYRDGHRILCGEWALCPLLRKALGGTMENLIVGIISLLLFGYLFLAMVNPEKF